MSQSLSNYCRELRAGDEGSKNGAACRNSSQAIKLKMRLLQDLPILQ